MSKSKTTTNPEWLHNSHAGELLVSEFMEPLGLTATALAESLGIDDGRLLEAMNGKRLMDADLDLGLARYFCMSEGFFLGPQIDNQLREARRALNSELERIVPVAA